MKVFSRTANYEIASERNGLFFQITRLTDGKSAFFQGDDALTLHSELDKTNHLFTDEDLCKQYDEVMA